MPLQLRKGENLRIIPDKFPAETGTGIHRAGTTGSASTETTGAAGTGTTGATSTETTGAAGKQSAEVERTQAARTGRVRKQVARVARTEAVIPGIIEGKLKMRKQNAMLAQIAAFDYQIDREPTEPLLHQTGRMLYITDGHGKIVIQDKVYQLFPGLIVVLMPWQVSQIIEVREPLRYILLAFNYTYINYLIKNNFESGDNYERLRDILYSVSTLYPRESTRQEFFSLFSSFAFLLDAGDDLYRPDSKSHDISVSIRTGLQAAFSAGKSNEWSHWAAVRLTSRLMELLAMYALEVKATTGEGNIIPADKVPDSYNPTRFFQYLYHNLDTYPTLKSAAEQFMMSESTLNRFVRRTTGENYTDLVKDMRIMKIIDFLLYSDFSLQEIAGFLGYKDASYISRLIHEKTGLHAQEIREQPHRANLLNRDRGLAKARAVCKYIGENYQSDISAIQVAETFDISTGALTVMLKETFDKTFNELLNEFRLSKACVLLLTTDMEITEIAFHVGYNSIKTFVRNFKAKYTYTPSSFRTTIHLQDVDLQDAD